jgi:flagellum-specific peptidoglycan hydrolase FlgJ
MGPERQPLDTNFVQEDTTTLQKFNTWKGEMDTLISTCRDIYGPVKGVDLNATLTHIADRKAKKTAINNSRTRAEKATTQVEYLEVHKIVKKSIWTGKANFIEEMEEEAEKAAKQKHDGAVHHH